MGQLVQRTHARIIAYIAAVMLLAINSAYLYCRIYGSLVISDPRTEPIYPMYDTLLAFGDSITEYGSKSSTNGFISQLSELYLRRMDILNRGFAGFNTSRALELADQVLPKTTPSRFATGGSQSVSTGWPYRGYTFPGVARTPELCFIFFGANDACYAPCEHHVPLTTFYKNLRTLVSLLRSPDSKYYSPTTRILLITPPPVGDRMWEDHTKHTGWVPDRRNNITKVYADAVIDVAKELGLPYVDLWSAIENLIHGAPSIAQQNAELPAKKGLVIERQYKKLLVQSSSGASDNVTVNNGKNIYGGYEKYLIEGLHLSAQGNDVLFELVVSEILKNWPELDPS
ncbi:SGNH hydrolase [Coemansia reversa NRRL 1564]|uniref:SGNH hydrolase n=1 Tax=Coemansia reversa (strain ATCC 12441 / NRRL 1564) TaxID=763665 RepID=A0A2G5BB70_COERN|nr:SGNH hydrolase [Coemansia reversa NRRL 1564]|eukprot:PIA16250.1 SGNH hydrolase [Coemansia reversa NRRL 1564]